MRRRLTLKLILQSLSISFHKTKERQGCVSVRRFIFFTEETASCAPFNNLLVSSVISTYLWDIPSFYLFLFVFWCGWKGGVWTSGIERRQTSGRRFASFMLYSFFLSHIPFCSRILDISFCLLASFPNRLISSLPLCNDLTFYTIYSFFPFSAVLCEFCSLYLIFLDLSRETNQTNGSEGSLLLEFSYSSQIYYFRCLPQLPSLCMCYSQTSLYSADFSTFFHKEWVIRKRDYFSPPSSTFMKTPTRLNYMPHIAQTPAPVASRYRARVVLDLSNTGIVDSNHAWGIFYFCCAVLAMEWTRVQEALPKCLKGFIVSEINCESEQAKGLYPWNEQQRHCANFAVSGADVVKSL
jgi:hypothetical protein